MVVEKDQSYYKNAISCILLICFGYALCNIGDAIIKDIGAKFHFSQIFVMFYSIVFVFTSLYGWKTEGKKAFITKKPKKMLLIALVAQVVAFCNLFALPNIELTTFYTAIFTSPLWVALLSAVFLKDKLGKERLAVMLFGFLVIMFVFRPGGDIFNFWTGLILVSAVAHASMMTLIRSTGTSESRCFIVLARSAVSLLISIPFLFSYYIAPTPYEWMMFILLGLVFSIAWPCIFYAFQHAPSAMVVAPYHYTQIVWGALIGYFVFNDVPNLDIIIGSALIIMAGLYLIYSERKYSKIEKGRI